MDAEDADDAQVLKELKSELRSFGVEPAVMAGDGMPQFEHDFDAVVTEDMLSYMPQAQPRTPTAVSVLSGCGAAIAVLLNPSVQWLMG